jgi:hypothetical protein
MNLIINAAAAVEETASEIAVAVGVETLTGPQLKGRRIVRGRHPWRVRMRRGA